MPIRFASLLLLGACLAASPAVADYKLEKGVAAAEEIPAALKELVETQGLRVLNDAGAPYAEFWFHKALTGSAQPPGYEILYGGVAEGTFLGVCRFVAQGSDFRGQRIKPGFYTMRYALMPADGNHMGAAQYRDFVLLLSVAADADPAAPLPFTEAVALSRKASGTGHPAVFPLASPESVAGPTLTKDYEENWILRTNVSTKCGEPMPVAITVFGRAEQ